MNETKIDWNKPLEFLLDGRWHTVKGILRADIDVAVHWELGEEGEGITTLVKPQALKRLRNVPAKPSAYYDAETWPKGEVWVRRDDLPLVRSIVAAVQPNGINCAWSGFVPFNRLADEYQLSTDGGATWSAARPQEAR